MLKKFFVERNLTYFDFLSLYCIIFLASQHGFWWMLLIIPQIIIATAISAIILAHS